MKKLMIYSFSFLFIFESQSLLAHHRVYLEQVYVAQPVAPAIYVSQPVAPVVVAQTVPQAVVVQQAPQGVWVSGHWHRGAYGMVWKEGHWH